PREEVADIADAHGTDGEAELLKRDAPDLRIGTLCHLGLEVAREELIAFAGPDTAGTTPALLAGGTRRPGLLELAHVVRRVERGLLDSAAVDHGDDVVDGDGRLGHVGGNHHLSL